MDLILWRHAEAAEADTGQDDLMRALTPKGQQQAKRMAAWLNTRLPKTTRILVSPAVRCQQTAQALGKAFETVPQIVPGGDVQAVLQAARWPQGVDTVLVVGHQPTMGLVAGFVLTGRSQALAFKKAAAWWLSSRSAGGAAGAVLKAVQSPENL